MRIRTAVAATALAALALLGSAGAAAAEGPADGKSRVNYGVNGDFILTKIEDSFNTVVVFGRM